MESNKVTQIITSHDKVVARNLKRAFELRKHTDRLTQRSLAEEIDLSQTAVNLYLNAKLPLRSKTTLIKFANALNVHPSEIDPKFKIRVDDKTAPATTRVVYSLTGDEIRSMQPFGASDKSYGVLLNEDCPTGLTKGIAVVDPLMAVKTGDWVCIKIKRKKGFQLCKLETITKSTLVPEQLEEVYSTPTLLTNILTFHKVSAIVL